MKGFLTSLSHKPLQRRLTLLTTATVALAIVLSNVAGYVALRVTIVRASQDIALSIAHDVLSSAADEVRRSGQLSEAVGQAAGVIIEAVSPTGVVARVGSDPHQLVLKPGDLTAAEPGARVVRRTGVDTSGANFVVVALPLQDTGYVLVVARPLGPVEMILAVQRIILLCVCVLSVLAAAIVAAVVARSALRPVRDLTAAVRHVTDTNDLQPISIRYDTGDLATLAGSFNLMLKSLGRERERQTRMVADASHELRTPLTSLRTNVELLNNDRERGRLTEGQTTEIFSDVQGQLGELSDLIGDLVHLARDDTALTLAPVDVRDVVNASVERVRRRAQGRLIEVSLEPFFVIANAEAFERAVTNLLDNAVKWSPPVGVVRVELKGNRLRVADAGPGIPEADLPYVFDRFFRGESARKTHGTGLGLSIVAKVVQELGGSVQAGRSREGGAEFTLQLPGVTTREAIPALLIPSSDSDRMTRPLLARWTTTTS